MKINDHKYYLTVDQFTPLSRPLRDHFNKNFENPHTTPSNRFVWDYWYVPNQYNLIRTPAYYYFPQNIYKKFHESLLNFGREYLGCYDITPPWLSYYVDGCEQQLHSDVPHGPWAFVFSLTNWRARKFTGGETCILKPSTLNFWQNFDSFNGIEKSDLSVSIPPLFNRLTVFDPRLPHSVNLVRGARDPREARLVIHGWFKNPEPYVVGALTRNRATIAVNRILDQLQPLFKVYSDCHGTMSLRFQVTARGQVRSPRFTTNTLVSLSNQKSRVQKLNRIILETVAQSTFPKSSGSTMITLPILFRF